MVAEKNSKEEAAQVIKGMIDDLATRTDIAEPEECESEGFDDTKPPNEDKGDQLATAKLALVPESEWAKLQVSKHNVFGDTEWDFQDAGSPIYESHAKVSWEQDIAEGVKLTDPDCEPLRRLLMACLYYYLPQNNIFGYCRSYNSVIPRFRGLVKVGRFLYCQRLFVDPNGNGSYLNASILTSVDIDRCIEEQPNISAKLSVAATIKFWQDLSDAKYLPKEYRLNKNSMSQTMVTKLQKEKIESSGSWVPISLESLAIVVPYCIDLIQNHSEEILRAYDFLHPVFANKIHKEQAGFTWGNAIARLNELKSATWNIDDFRTKDGKLNALTKQALISTVRSHPDWPAYQVKHFPRKSRISHRLPVRQQQFNNLPHSQILKAAKDLGIDLDHVGDGTILYDLPQIRHTFMGIFTTFRDACQIILCLVTGMRKSELLHLKANKAWAVPGTDNEYRLEFDVFKTDEASQGDTVVIPIPDIAYKAYNVLENITQKARQYGESDYLSVNITMNFGNKAHPNVINKRLCEFWEDLGIEEDIHPHMFRKTLAMFAIYQDPRNLTVIKHLFSHKSLAMTLAYIVKIPGLSEDIKLAIIKHNADLLAEVIVAAKNERIGGTCGSRIKEQVKSGAIAARLNDEGRESIEQYIQSLLEHGLRLLHRCPLNVICTNTHDSIVHVGPELCNCEVTNCDYAVFTEASIPALVEELRFHEQWIKHPLVSEDQIRFSRRKIKDCLDRLAEIQGKEAAMAEFPEHYGLVA